MNAWQMVRSAVAAAVVALGASAAIAGNTTITVDKSSLAVGETVTVTVASANPADDVSVEGGLWDAANGFGAGNFILAFNPAALSFGSVSFAPWMDGGSFAGIDAGDPSKLDVSLFFFDQSAAVPGTLFTATFTALATSTSETFGLTPDPIGPNGGTADSFFDIFTEIQIKGTTPPIPEPSTYALMGLGLAAIGLTARRRAQRAA